MSLNHFASFIAPASLGDPHNESDLRKASRPLGAELIKRGLDLGNGDFFDSEELSGFTIMLAGEECLVGLSRDFNAEGRWSLQVQLRDLGLFPRTRRRRLAAMNQLEHQLHLALQDALGATAIAWTLGDKQRRADPGPPPA